VASQAGAIGLLREGLGRARSDVYRVRLEDGRPCIFVSHYGGTCATTTAPANGVSWIVGGAHDDVPGVFVGLATDDVKSIAVSVDGRPISVTFESSVAFGQIPAGGEAGVVTTVRRDGSVVSAPFPLSD
jgi:hypothetical protein